MFADDVLQYGVNTVEPVEKPKDFLVPTFGAPFEDESMLIDAVVKHSLTGIQPTEYGYEFTDSQVLGTDEQVGVTQILLPLETTESTKEQVGKIRSIAQKLGCLGVAFKVDAKNSETKIQAAGWAALTVATQAADRARLVLVYGTPFAVEASNTANNSLIGPVVLASIFAVSNFATGEALTQSMDHFKGTKESFRNDFPLTVELFADALAGVASKELTTTEPTDEALVMSAEDDSLDTPWYKKLKLPLPVRRSMTGVGLGSTAFVATSSMLGKSNKEVRAINAKVTRDTSGFIIVVGTGLLEGIKRMYNYGWESEAKFLSDHAQDGKTWLGFAGISIVGTFVSNKLAKRKLQKQHKTEQDAPVDTL